MSGFRILCSFQKYRRHWVIFCRWVGFQINQSQVQSRSCNILTWNFTLYLNLIHRLSISSLSLPKSSKILMTFPDQVSPGSNQQGIYQVSQTHCYGLEGSSHLKVNKPANHSAWLCTVLYDFTILNFLACTWLWFIWKPTHLLRMTQCHLYFWKIHKILNPDI